MTKLNINNFRRLNIKLNILSLLMIICLCFSLFFNTFGTINISAGASCDPNGNSGVDIVVSEADRQLYLVQDKKICFTARAYLPKCKNKNGQECKGRGDKFGAEYPLPFGNHSIYNIVRDLAVVEKDVFYDGPAFVFKKLKGSFEAAIHGVSSKNLVDNDSHGCIRISGSNAREIYKFVGNGSSVTIIEQSYSGNSKVAPRQNNALNTRVNSNNKITPSTNRTLSNPKVTTKSTPASGSSSTACEVIRSEIKKIRDNAKYYSNSKAQIEARESKLKQYNCT
jgi:L,D-transpeptidase catalytic domain